MLRYGMILLAFVFNLLIGALSMALTMEHSLLYALLMVLITDMVIGFPKKKGK